MKRCIFLACTIMLFFCVLMGCSVQKGDEEQKKTVRIGVTMYSEFDPFTEDIRKNIEEYLQAYGKVLSCDVDCTVVYSNSNQLVQNDQVEDFIDKEYDVVCVNLVDRTDPSVIIEKAKSADVPIIFFNRELVEDDLKRFDKLYYVGAKPEESGRLQGEIVLDALSERFEEIDVSGDGVIQYVLLEGEAGHQDAILRSRVSVDTIETGGIRLERLGDEIANWDRRQAQTKITSLLQGYPRQIELVLANDDNMALGALDALTDFGVQKLPLIVGVNGQEEVIEDISEGLIEGTVLNNSKEKGKIIAHMAVSLALEDKIPDSIQLEKGKYYYVPYQKIGK